MNKKTFRNNILEKIEAVVEEKEITVVKIKTRYMSAGYGAPVILLHGAGAGGITWYPTIGAIAKNFQVIVPDIVGYGESDKPDDAPYDRPYFTKWLKEFMKALNIPKAHIVGLSQGGAIALQFVIDNPYMVNKLVVVDSAGLGAKVSFWPMIGMIWTNIAPSSFADRFNASFILHNPKNRDPNHPLYSIAVLKDKGGKNAFRKGRGAAVAKIEEALLNQIKNETLIIWGKEDRLFSMEYGEVAAKLMPNAKLKVIPDAGHLPLMDNPKQFNSILSRFLVN